MSDVTIRPASTQDIEAIFSIRTSVVENHLSREQMAQMGITTEALGRLIAAQTCAWITEIDGVPVGFSMVDFEDGSLFALFIRPAYEGRGIGKRLLLLAEEVLFAHHERLWLETSLASRAAEFYQRNGWQRVETMAHGDARFEKCRADAAA